MQQVDFYRKRALKKLVQLLIAMTAIILFGVMVGIIKGTPGVGRLAMVAPVAVGCTAIAILGRRRDRAWIAYTAGAVYLLALASLTVLR